MVEQACRNCHFLTTANICPNCKKTTLTKEWAGELIIINPKSVLAMLRQRVAVNVPGYPNQGESEVGDLRCPGLGRG